MQQEQAGSGQKLGLIAAIALVVGNMIGSGVFLLPATLAPYGWNGVLAWFLTGSGALVLAYILSRLTRALPDAGGLSGFVDAAFGPIAAFLIGWIYLVSIWTAVVTIAVAAISHLSALFPFLSAGEFRPAIAAMVLLWILTALNLRGAKAAGHFQIVTTVLKVLPLIAVVVLAVLVLAKGEGSISPFDASSLHFGSVNAAAALTLWALVGFESASVAVAKVRNPEVNVPRATLWGTGLTALFYVLVCSAIALMLPPEVVAKSPAPFATFVQHFWSARPAELVTLFVVISCVGALNGWVLLQGEMPRAMAEKGILPRWLAQTDAGGTPVRALLVSAMIATLFVVMNGARSMQGLFEYMLLLSTSASLWVYLACSLAAFKLRIARPLAVLGAVYSLWTLWGAGIGVSGLSFLLMASGIPMLWWARRTSAAVEKIERASL
ncbi:MAG: amino acid permease [Candidatus Andeanibacterium colombiense]|uniref:Arginine/agmatine antiporter n=1 Tax=Candidatus Andeanibacterium colombiense TaxID=3121345 RepID=A0AAJ6BQI8_9SPHN|nr:MAG: amino acid permease [Sphingomonadaceae bacterium]